MPVKAPPVFEAEVSPADFTFHDRRGFLLGLGALLVPKRSIFLPPLGGWPEKPWACIQLNGGYYYDGGLAGKLKMVITPLVRFRNGTPFIVDASLQLPPAAGPRLGRGVEMAETVGFEPTRGVSLITGFKPDKHAECVSPCMADREGFEPSATFRLRLFSKELG